MLFCLYDLVAVFGDPKVCSITDDLSLPQSLEAKLRYFGFVVPREVSVAEVPTEKSGVLISFGAGENRFNLLNDPVRNLINGAVASGMRVQLIKGKTWSKDVTPALDPSTVRDIEVLEFERQDEFFSHLSKAEYSFVAGGYNSTYESLAWGAKTIICIDTEKHRIEEILTRAQMLSRGNYCQYAGSGMTYGSAKKIILI